jgi:hypothetical protein
MPVQIWLIDRPALESDLRRMNLQSGTRLFSGRLSLLVAPVKGEQALVVVEAEGRATAIHARHPIDASGRACLLGRRLGLSQQPAVHGHNAGRATLRVSGVDAEVFLDVPAGLSTLSLYHGLQYFFGPGYWVSLTPTRRRNAEAVVTVLHYRDSVPGELVDSPDAVLEFLRRHQAVAHRVVAGGAVSDFHYEPSTARLSLVIFSPDR